jgi:uncharacterized protein (DUF934 family)
MSKLIKNNQVLADEWKSLRLANNEAPHNAKLPMGPVLVPLAVWQARRMELIHREYEHGWPLGLRIAADESPQAIARDIEDFTVIAVEFNKYSDGNSYMTARLLRERYGYKGELRAVGDVPQNRLAYLQQIGFDAIEVRPGRHLGFTLSNLFDFSQKTTDTRLAVV